LPLRVASTTVTSDRLNRKESLCFYTVKSGQYDGKYQGTVPAHRTLCPVALLLVEKWPARL
jgi:hypothetical protein